MNIRRFRTLHESGATFAEIGRECGCDWRTVRKYLAEDAASVPPAGTPRIGSQPLSITPFIPLVEAWLRADLRIKGTVVHERLVAEYGFTGHYQRVKMFLAEARPRIAAELADRDENPLSGLHRRFEVVPGAQAQVDWGDEGDLLAHVGIPTVYSFHMVLSHSRDPFCCFTTSMDLATFWDCHRRGFAHFGRVPGGIVYDRTKTVIRRHVAPGVAVPLHPAAADLAAAGGKDAAGGRRRGHRLARAVKDLTELLEATRRIAAQTRQPITGVTPDGATRLVSLHDPDARPIAKGRLGKPVEFGHKAQVCDNDDGIVLDHEVQPGNPADAPQLGLAVERVKKRTGRTPRTVAADRGYGEQTVDDALHDLGIKQRRDSPQRPTR